MPGTQPYDDPVWRIPFTDRRIPWRLFLLLWHVRKRAALLWMNLLHRRPLLTMIDRSRLLPDAVPVLINNFNRLETLKVLIDWLRQLPEPLSIIIIDNASSYPPLTDYYAGLRKDPDIQIARLGYNSGLEGLEDATKELTAFAYYIVTDPDLVPYADTPADILARMRSCLEQHPELSHVGACLEIDDLPDHYPLRERVREWEARYWPPQAKPVGTDAYAAWVDTTFAMYRRGADVTQVEPAARLARPYRLRHVDWYLDPVNLTEEQRFYRETCGAVASWTAREQAGTD